MAKTKVKYVDESVPAHPELDRGYPVVVFGDHRLCAGISTRVHVMPGPHMHSQIEINLVRKGSMTYWFDGQEVTLRAGELGVFWGMIPHQVIRCAPQTEFVVLYIPMSALLAVPSLKVLRQRLFSGSFLRAKDLQNFDPDVFERWRRDLNTNNPQLEPIVRDEVTSRLRRMDHEGWHELRSTAEKPSKGLAHLSEQDRALKVEHMAQFIGERALEKITIDDVAKSVRLHPNYAMGLYKRAIGMSIKQSITRHKLDAVRSMLIATELPIASIAFDCGFGSLSSFYESFEQRFKTSPASFRKSVVAASNA